MMAQCVLHLDDTAVFILYLLFGLKYIYIVGEARIFGGVDLLDG